VRVLTLPPGTPSRLRKEEEEMKELHYRVNAYLMKFLYLCLEIPGRLFIFNLSFPEVGRKVLDIPYGSAARRKQSLDVFVPQGPPPYPVLVYTHGSGFHVSDKKSFRRICACYADRGYLVFNVNYRLAPACGFPGQVSDVARAIRWAYDHAPEYGGNNSRMFLGGDSAGAVLSSLYAGALHEGEQLESLGISNPVPADCLKGLLLFYGGYDVESAGRTHFPFMKTIIRGWLGEKDVDYPRRVELVSPARHVADGYPPSYICAGSWDPLRSESVLFDRVLSEKGIPHRTRIFSWKYLDGHHGFLSVPFSKCSRIAMRESLEFMDERG
jgi:acetyl esterase/lipase